MCGDWVDRMPKELTVVMAALIPRAQEIEGEHPGVEICGGSSLAWAACEALAGAMGEFHMMRLKLLEYGVDWGPDGPRPTGGVH